MEPSRAHIDRTLALQFTEGDCIELRAFSKVKKTQNGYFYDRQKLAEHAVQLNNDDYQVYVVLNPVTPEQHATRPEQIGVCGIGEGTADSQIVCRRWMVIDCDPVKSEKKGSATNQEKEAASQVAHNVFDYLVTGCKWPEPVSATSGNGFWLLFRLDDLPSDQETRWLVQRPLIHLAEKFNTPHAKVDRSTFSAAQLVKLLGTVAKKGTATEQRPHRLSAIIRVPKALQAVTRVDLTALVGTPPAQKPPPKQTQPGDGVAWDVPKLLADRSWDYIVDSDWIGYDGYAAVLYKLPICPLDGEHDNGAAFIGQWKHNQAVFFGCHHDGCAGKTWPDLKTAWNLPDSPSADLLEQIKASLPPTEPESQQPVIVHQPLRLRPVSETVDEETRWLWHHRLPLGKISIVAGDGGVGKTSVLCSIAAMLSNGQQLPGNDPQTEVFSGTTIFISDEEDSSDVHRRVVAAGGDPVKILCLAEDEVFNSYLQDVPRLATAMERLGDVRLIVFDTLPDFIGEFNDHHNSGVRQGLRTLVRLAKATGVVVVGLCHFNKNSSSHAMHRLLGSVAYVNLPRSVIYVLPDPGNETRRLIHHRKNNLGPRMMFPAFHLAESNGRIGVQWESEITGVSDEHCEQLLTPDRGGADSKREFAKEWLQGIYGIGAGPKPPAQVKREAKQAGISERTLYRAADELEVVREGKEWRLKNSCQPPTP